MRRGIEISINTSFYKSFPLVKTLETSLAGSVQAVVFLGWNPVKFPIFQFGLSWRFIWAWIRVQRRSDWILTTIVLEIAGGAHAPEIVLEVCFYDSTLALEPFRAR